jgi:hypothetical protein
MLRLRWFSAAVAAAGLLAAGPLARAADDTHLLRLDKSGAPTVTLGDDDRDADTVLIGHGGGHGGGGHGGFHGGHASFHGGHASFNHASFHGGHASFNHASFHSGFHTHYGYGRGWYGYGRGWYGYGRGWYGYPYWYGYRPYYRWWGAGYWPYYAYSSPYYYSYPSTVYYGGYYDYPSTTVVVPSASLSTSPYLQGTPAPAQAIETAPPPAVVPADGTFPYDGGPRNPPPMPRAEPAPPGAPATFPLNGNVVSAPAKTTYRYLAYGEKPKPAPVTPGRTDTYLIKANTARPSGH